MVLLESHGGCGYAGLGEVTRNKGGSLTGSGSLHMDSWRCS
jgi:hypothetical protein